LGSTHWFTEEAVKIIVRVIKYVVKTVTVTVTLTGWLGIRTNIIDLKICRTVVNSYTVTLQ